jgi:hypothetical protein
MSAKAALSTTKNGSRASLMIMYTLMILGGLSQYQEESRGSCSGCGALKHCSSKSKTLRSRGTPVRGISSLNKMLSDNFSP